ncbi:anillin isoform X2 [Pseudochaenichthys georgianus]|uniref:anillin isoform X2 n=1 Tax=Pseudochaenichthys georgianus TaxID=52239 RepID=UPI00146DE5A4|nr:anillin isoform X1 [Pseudochaenichthys georgianus]
MDPFTEKLLERTRARRENLQKKMADRPNAASRAMVKRPLADANSATSGTLGEKVPQLSSKPSPSKRRCSEENVAGEENQEPAMSRSVAPVLSDPPTDKKPPTGPNSVRHASSLERNAPRPVEKMVGVSPPVAQSFREEQKKVGVSPPVAQSFREEEAMVPVRSTPRRKEDPEEDEAPPTAGMRSRLQRLAAQRKYWDGDDSSEAAPDPPSPPKRHPEAAAAPPTPSSGPPAGRRGRLANLAATIGSWEDDLSHAAFPTEKQSSAVPTSAGRGANGAIGAKPSPAGSKSTPGAQALYGPPKPGRIDLPTPQKVEVPAARAALQSVSSIQGPSSPQKSSIQGASFPSTPQKSSIQGASFPSTPQKSSIQGASFPSTPQKSSIQGPCSPQKSSIQGASFPSSPQKSSIQGPCSPQKAGPSSLTSVSQSPLKTQALSRNLNPVPSPQKPELRTKPTITGSSGPKGSPGGPGVKSFLERFGEKCQERSNLSSPAGGSRTPAGTPSSLTPNTRLVQERLRAATHTTTADLTQKQKLERESELAQIRSRFQKGSNLWKDQAAGTNTNTDVKEQPEKPVESGVSQRDEPEDAAAQRTDTPTKSVPPGHGTMSPPASTSSPLRVLRPAERTTEEEEEEEEVKEREMNVDSSINSAVINQLFEGVLDQSDEDDEDEEDALNISSMSLIIPLESVAAVVKSPESRMMTSTPATSFLVKSGTPEEASRRSKFQRSNMVRGASSGETLEEERGLPYSIDSYRSIRVKETERPAVKQVIVRKEDVTQRAEEPRGAALINVKQKMKVLSTGLNLQQTVIHQASQALNCCTDEEHGRGSQVEAEAERLLLVATEKREALKAELERLTRDPTGQKKPLSAPGPSGPSASKGSVTLQELRLPLKADFVCSIANKPEATKHSFFLMLRAGVENTVATPLASTHRGLSGDTLSFPTSFTISDVSSDFEIDVEVYSLVQRRDVGNDKKKKASKSKAMTPKRFLAITKSVQTPVMASPGGPNSVRTSNFLLVGSHKLTLASIGQNKFHLDKVPFLCPLEGNVYLKMQCEVGSQVEERGFLTLFEDVSGFGSWHRRWCVLSGYCISYWTYPDDEKRKNPIGRLNLRHCTSQRVDPVNREFCARPNTLELITVRPQRAEDRETLVSQCTDTMCVTKNWLSADTKDERSLWMSQLNQILVDLRVWQPDACYRPQ